MKNIKLTIVLLTTILSTYSYADTNTSVNIEKTNPIYNLDYDYMALIEAAKLARENAYCPYSGFKVGAALLTKDDKIFTGVNVENLVQAPGSCAERTAIVKAVSEGYREFKAIAVIANTPDVCAPCGVCRQVILEFGTDIDVIMTNMAGTKLVITKISQLVPYSFSPADLKYNNENPENK